MLLRRLRAWSLRSWAVGSRVADTRAALQQLADLSARAESRANVMVPDAGVHALADQLEVLSSDALRAGVGAPSVAAVLDELTARLGLR